MGNSESNLTTRDVTQTETSNNNNANNNNNNNTDEMPHEQARRRRRHLSSTHSTSGEMPDSDPWWWEIENENLILDQVPSNVTTMSASESVPTRHGGDGGSGSENDRLLKHVVSDTTTLNVKRHIVGDGEIVAVAIAADESKSEMPPVDSSNVNVPQEQTLEEFKEELRVKRLARQTAVQDLRDEISTLRKQLASEQAITRSLREHKEPNELTAEPSLITTKADDHDHDDDDDDDVCEPPSMQPDDDDTDPEARSRHANIELANAQLALQLANADNISLRAELGVVQRQVGTLKEVITCCKQMLNVKEEQCTQLKAKLQEIEASFGEREMKIMSNNLRQEYERQLVNIRQLRQLYEERQRVAAAEYENLQRLISIKKDELIAEQEKTKNFEEHNQTLVKEVEAANNELAALRDEVREHKYEKGTLKEEMSAVNTLFSQMVMGFNGKNNLDIDRLTEMLEENRALLNEMTQREGTCSDGATLPKLLFELVEQAAIAEATAKSRSATPTPTPTPIPKLEATQSNAETEGEPTVAAASVAALDNDEGATSTSAGDGNGDVTDCAISLFNTSAATKQQGSISNNNKRHRKRMGNGVASAAVSLKCYEPEIMGKVASAQEIVGNLPKVWKVLMELLSHHKNEQVKFAENAEDCYKSVETANGTKTELSVSKTYIKLKDLILEKKALVKETNRLKTLNSHLDYRLNEQEKRLSAVSLELTKTWHLVGKMQRQHRQLHTQEQILRYQLQQKRRLLTELKDELEYCRRKWAAARAKNDESQVQCDDLRREFARRKLEDANHSAESGYSDSGQQTDDEEQRAGLTGIADDAKSIGSSTLVDAVAVPTTTTATATVATATGNCRRKHLKESFEHTRKIKRMQSTSPGRAIAANGGETGSAEDIVLRWNSAPPTCGWRERDDDEEEEEDDVDDDVGSDNDGEMTGEATNANGAIPKRCARNSRSKQRNGASTGNSLRSADADVCVSDAASGDEQREERATRIQKLEEQCKSLIQQVLETSGNRERLEIQLCRFQDEIAPVQYAVPLEDFINRKRLERMTRASSAPATGTLTPREEEYTRKRSERLGRLEEESKQLLSRIRRTVDRGHYLRCSLDRRIRRAPSREGSFESNTEEEPTNSTAGKTDVTSPAESDAEKMSTNKNALTANEEEYTARRAARLQRLEQESKLLLSQLSRNTQRGDSLGNKLDALHERYSSDGGNGVATEADATTTNTAAEPLAVAPLSVEQRLEDIEKVTANRQARLQILEQEGRELLERLSNTAERGEQMVNRIRAREASSQARNEILAAEVLEVESSAPTLNTVACSSIVNEELNACIAVTTTTPSQIAKQQQGAIPKTKPQAQLCAAQRQQRAAEKQVAKPECDESATKVAQSETLEDMVRRLRGLPFPTASDADATQTSERAENQSQVTDKVEESATEK